jgi:hypothetical protein
VDVWTFNDYDTNTHNPRVRPLPLLEHAQYKYLVSADGYTCSTRLEKLLALDSAVLMQHSVFHR